jgi:hypothetical protein
VWVPEIVGGAVFTGLAALAALPDPVNTPNATTVTIETLAPRAAPRATQRLLFRPIRGLLLALKR